MSDPTVKRGRGRPPKSELLQSLTPQQAEEVAKWLEKQAEKLPLRIEQGSIWLIKNPGDAQMVNQITYWRNFISIVKHLAYLVRRVHIHQGGKP